MANNTFLQKFRSYAPLTIILLVWLLAIYVGTHQLLMYEFTSDSESDFPNTWPKQSELSLDEKRYTLLMAIHPKCSCSNASLEELSKITARLPGQLHANALFIAPQSASQKYVQSKNWHAAQAIPGLRVIQDNDGKLAHLFHLKTSGATLLYDHNGNLVFSGGITSSRGHSGDNLGSQAVFDIVSGISSAIHKTTAFGCHLFNEK